MKSIIILFTTLLLVSSCSDDFLERVPQDKISSESFWTTKKDAGDITAESDFGYNYEGIRRFNYFLDNIEKAPIEESLKKSYQAEVRTLRAWTYFDLAKRFGAVPLITKYTTDAQEVMVTPTPENEVIQFVINELNAAIIDLPITQEYKALINKAAALTIKARVHLFYNQWNEALHSQRQTKQMTIQNLLTLQMIQKKKNS